MFCPLFYGPEHLSWHLMDCSRRLSVEPGFQGARQPSRRASAQRDRPRPRFESRSNVAMIDELCSSWAESTFFGVAKKAFRDGDGEKQLEARRVASGSSARRRHIHTGGWLLRRCLQYPPDRMEPVPAPGNLVPTLNVCSESSIQSLPRRNSPEVSTAVVAVSHNQTGCQ